MVGQAAHTAVSDRKRVENRVSSTHKYCRLLPYITRQWPSLVLIIALSAVTSLVTALEPWPMKILVDCALSGNSLPELIRPALESLPLTPSPAVLILAATLCSLGLFALNSTLQVGLTWAWSVAGQRMVNELTVDLFHRLQRLSLLFHSRRAVGDSLSRLSGDTWCIYSLTDRLLAPGQQAILLATTGMVAWQLDRELAALSLGLAPLLAVSSIFFGRKLKRITRLSREAQTRLLSFVQQTLTSIPVVQAFSTEDLNRQRFRHLQRGCGGVVAAGGDGQQDLWSCERRDHHARHGDRALLRRTARAFRDALPWKPPGLSGLRSHSAGCCPRSVENLLSSQTH